MCREPASPLCPQLRTLDLNATRLDRLRLRDRNSEHPVSQQCADLRGIEIFTEDEGLSIVGEFEFAMLRGPRRTADTAADGQGIPFGTEFETLGGDTR